jgi:hypothetical protein
VRVSSSWLGVSSIAAQVNRSIDELIDIVYTPV